MPLRLYALDWNPNGTNDLIVADVDSDVIACLPEALFGVDVAKNQVGDGRVVTDGETVWYHRGALDGVTVARELTVGEALRNAAVSPCDDGSAVEKFLTYYGLKA